MGEEKKKRIHCSLLGFSKVLKSFRSCRSPNSFSTPYISSPLPSPTNQYPQDFPGFSRAKKTQGRECDGEVNPVDLMPAYLWRKEDKWRVVMDDPNKPCDFFLSPQRSKIDSDDFFPPLSIPKPSYRKSKRVKNSRYYNNNQKKKKKKRKTSSRGRSRTSFADTRLFSSDEDEDDLYTEFKDNETPIYSSSSLSTLADCHDYYYQHNPPRRISTESSSMFQQRMKRISSSSSCTAGGGKVKVRDSFAVVKRTNDPYTDFRRSMLEMVIENQIYDASDLEDLLRCFLSLNDDEHHKTIIRAFSDVHNLFVSFSVSNCLTPLPPL